MTGNPRAKNLGRTTPPRPSSVSGARPVPTEARDSWLDVDDIVQFESRPAPAAVTPTASVEPAQPVELEQRLREQQLELEQLRLESARRIRLAESERDAALAVVEELRANLQPAPVDVFAASSLAPPSLAPPSLAHPSFTPPSFTPPNFAPPNFAPPNVAQPIATHPHPPPLPRSAQAVSHPPSISPARARVSAQAPAPHPDASAPARRLEPGSVPTLSEVLVATDLPGHDPEAVEPDERRSEPRISRQFEVEFNYETHFFAGLTLDISSGGLFIATYHLLPVGTALSLSFQLPDGNRLSVRGEVRWVRCASEGHERPGMGVAFKALTHEALVAISDFCAERPPLYMDL